MRDFEGKELSWQWIPGFMVIPFALSWIWQIIFLVMHPDFISTNLPLVVEVFIFEFVCVAIILHFAIKRTK